MSYGAGERIYKFNIEAGLKVTEIEENVSGAGVRQLRFRRDRERGVVLVAETILEEMEIRNIGDRKRSRSSSSSDSSSTGSSSSGSTSTTSSSGSSLSVAKRVKNLTNKEEEGRSGNANMANRCAIGERKIENINDMQIAYDMDENQQLGRPYELRAMWGEDFGSVRRVSPEKMNSSDVNRRKVLTELNKENKKSGNGVSQKGRNATENVKRERYRVLKRKVKGLPRRKMMVKEEKEGIDAIEESFFEVEEDEIWRRVERMSHSKRFWLAVKFYKEEPANYSGTSICHIFGVSRSVIRRFVKTKGIGNFEEYGGYAPCETLENRGKVKSREFFRVYASNVEELKRCGIL